MRYSVLTYNFGGYEPVREIWEKDPEAEYILVTDDVKAQSATWHIIYQQYDDNTTVWDKCYNVRFRPFLYVHTDIVIRLDASIEIRKPLKTIIDEFELGQYDRCMMIHPERKRIRDEYGAWCELRGYPHEQAAKMMAIMAKLGYNVLNPGLFQACFEVVRKNRTNDLVNDITFDLLRYAAADGHIQRINQTWRTMVINHLFKDELKVLPVSQNIITDGDMMQWHYHGGNEPITTKPSITPIMFGKPIKPWW